MIKQLLFIFFLSFITLVFASEQSLLMGGVDEDELQKDGQKIVEYLNAINNILDDFGEANIDQECLRYVESREEKISPNTIIYINEWLRYPALCASSKNRYKNESVKKCQKRSRTNFKKLIPFIEVAASEFELNPNHLACLLLQESQFLDTAQSGTGPLGLAQISKGTQQTEKAIFTAKLPSTCNQTLSVPCVNIRSSAKRIQCRKDVRYCLRKQKLVAKRRILAPRWKQYADYANQNVKPYYYMNSQKYCKKTECRKNEYWAVGAAALYIKEIMEFDLGDDSLKAADSKELFLMGTALYNPGPGKKKQIISGSLELFSSGWEESIDKKKFAEPRQYVERIRQCIEYKIGYPIIKQ
jgi:hypothetical protein